MTGEDSRSKGKLFEHQVAAFMTKRGWQPTLGRHFPGRIAVRKHDCDIFAKRRSIGWSLTASVCFLLVVAGAAYWSGWLSARLQEDDVPTGFLTSLNWLAPLGFLLGSLAAKRSTKYVWVECKNLQQSIKRDLIMKLKDQFRDASKMRGTWECWLVSTSRFDEDAIIHAKAHGVTCYQVVEPGGRNMALHRVDSKTGDV